MSEQPNGVVTGRQGNRTPFYIRSEDQDKVYVIERVHEFDDESDGTTRFVCTVIVFEMAHQIYTARVPKRLSLQGFINLAGVIGVPVNMEFVFPALDHNLLVGCEPFPSDVYRKIPTLAYYSSRKADEYGEQGSVEAHLVMREVRNMEIMNRSPNINIAKYYGCNVRGGRIVGFYLEKLEHNLYERLERAEEPVHVDQVMKGVRNAVEHVHKLGLCHNDINPSNVMFRKNGCPVVVDFDSCLPTGERLSIKAGTEGWYDANQELSDVHGDLAALDELEAFLRVETVEDIG